MVILLVRNLFVLSRYLHFKRSKSLKKPENFKRLIFQNFSNFRQTEYIFFEKKTRIGFSESPNLSDTLRRGHFLWSKKFVSGFEMLEARTKKILFEISRGRILRKSTFYVSRFVSHLTLWQELQNNVRPRQLAYRRRSRQFTSLLQWSTEFPSPVFNFLHVRIGKKTKCETDFPKFQTSFHRSVCNTTTWDTNGGISSQFSKICHSYAHNWYVMGNRNICSVG